MKISILSLFILLTSIGLRGQEMEPQNDSLPYFITTYEGLTPCKAIKAVRTAGNVYKFIITRLNGKEQIIYGKETCEQVTSYFDGKYTYDLVPLLARKPEGYQRHMMRLVDGRYKAYIHYHNINYSPGHMESYTFHFKVNDDRFIKVNDIKLKKEILPLLNECTEFKNNYNGDISSAPETFELMLNYYNSACSE